MIEGFPVNEVEFDRRFHTDKVCFDSKYLQRYLD
jgi:hypothetical protein